MTLAGEVGSEVPLLSEPRVVVSKIGSTNTDQSRKTDINGKDNKLG